MALVASPLPWSWACAPGPFTCRSAVDCVNSQGVQGVCVAEYCAYADVTCPGREERYSVSAGDGLASSCVPLDAGATDGAQGGPDAGIVVTSCGDCSRSEVCVATVTPGGPCATDMDAAGCSDGATTSSGGVVYTCSPSRRSCDDGGLTASCASLFCPDACPGSAVREAGVECLCSAP